MKVAVFASGEFSVPLIKHLIDKGELAVLFTKTDKPKGRGMKLKPTPAASAASGVDIIKSDKLNKKLLTEYLAYDVDVAVVIDYGIYVPSYFHKREKPFMVNVHPSLLPRWRGPAPIQWTIYAGDTETGITLHKLVKEIDAGDILYQVKYPLTGREKATQLEEFLANKLPDIWDQFVDLYLSGRIKPVPQGENVSYAPMFDKSQFHIDFSKSCEEIDRLVRALADVPGTYSVFRGKKVKILFGKCKPESENTGQPGQIMYVSKDYFGIATSNGIFIPLEVKPEGKRAMEIKEFIQGYRPEVGEFWT